MEKAPTVVVGGIAIANFSSPHPFRFTTGEVLAACSPERSQALVLESGEQSTPGIKGTTDIRLLSFRMSEEVRGGLAELEADPAIDIVIVPFPVVQAMREAGLPLGKARCCRTSDRVTKTIFADRFCV